MPGLWPYHQLAPEHDHIYCEDQVELLGFHGKDNYCGYEYGARCRCDCDDCYHYIFLIKRVSQMELKNSSWSLEQLACHLEHEVVKELKLMITSGKVNNQV